VHRNDKISRRKPNASAGVSARNRWHRWGQAPPCPPNLLPFSLRTWWWPPLVLFHAEPTPVITTRSTCRRKHSSHSSALRQDEIELVDHGFGISSSHRFSSTTWLSLETTEASPSSTPEPPSLAGVDPAVSSSLAWSPAVRSRSSGSVLF
jgi:hypothetical protein